MTRPATNSRREFIPPTKRRKMTRARRVSIFLAANGICHICGKQIRDGEKWDVSHVIPLNLGGADTDDNMRPAHKRCHVEQTAKDKADIAERNRAIDTNYAGPETKRRGFRKPPPSYKYDWQRRGYAKP